MTGVITLLVGGLLTPTVLWGVTAANLRQRCDHRFSGRDDTLVDHDWFSAVRPDATELVGTGTTR